MTRTIRDWLSQRGLTIEQLVEASGVDKRVVRAIVEGRYTPSPEQRQQLAAALGVTPEEIVWGHVALVSHVYGHGPQFGRSP